MNGEARSAGLPHFLGIGAQRSGTTWLYQHLRPVPGIWLPPVKELHYFDRIDPGYYRDQGAGTRRLDHHLWDRLARNARDVGALLRRLVDDLSHEGFHLPGWALNYYGGKPSDAWYVGLFRGAARRGLVTGEITPGYSLLSGPTVARIGAINPGLKVIFIMRDPVERMWSGAVKRLVSDTGRAWAEVTEDEFLAFFTSRRSLARADYLATLNRWEAVFPPQNIHVEFFESIREEPETMLRRIVAFLGIPAARVPAASASRGRNAAAADGPPLPPRLHREIARIVEPHIDALATRYPDKVREWRRNHADFFPRGGTDRADS